MFSITDLVSSFPSALREECFSLVMLNLPLLQTKACRDERRRTEREREGDGDGMKESNQSVFSVLSVCSDPRSLPTVFESQHL